MSIVVADTGPLVALFNARDAYHDWTTERFKEIVPPLVTCEAVLADASHLLRRVPRGRRKLFALLARNVLKSDFSLQQEHERVGHLMEKYRDVPMALADACIVRKLELAPSARVWTLDSDFRIYRRNGRQRIPVLAPW